MLLCGCSLDINRREDFGALELLVLDRGESVTLMLPRGVEGAGAGASWSVLVFMRISGSPFGAATIFTGMASGGSTGMGEVIRRGGPFAVLFFAVCITLRGD